MHTICSREIFTKKCPQQQNFDSDPKEAWHYNHVTFTLIAKTFVPYCRLIYMLSMLYVRFTMKVKVGIPESFKLGWYSHKITGSSHPNWWVDQLCVDLRNRTVLNTYGLILGSLPTDKVYIIYLHEKVPKVFLSWKLINYIKLPFSLQTIPQPNPSPFFVIKLWFYLCWVALISYSCFYNCALVLFFVPLILVTRFLRPTW